MRKSYIRRAAGVAVLSGGLALASMPAYAQTPVEIAPVQDDPLMGTVGQVLTLVDQVTSGAASPGGLGLPLDASAVEQVDPVGATDTVESTAAGLTQPRPLAARQVLAARRPLQHGHGHDDGEVNAGLINGNDVGVGIGNLSPQVPILVCGNNVIAVIAQAACKGNQVTENQGASVIEFSDAKHHHRGYAASSQGTDVRVQPTGINPTAGKKGKDNDKDHRGRKGHHDGDTDVNAGILNGNDVGVSVGNLSPQIPILVCGNNIVGIAAQAACEGNQETFNQGASAILFED